MARILWRPSWDEVLRDIKACPGFVCFACSIADCIEEGESLPAFRALAALPEVTPQLAHEIIEDWPTPEVRFAPELSIDDEAFVRLWCFVPHVGRIDWDAVAEASAPLGGSL